MDEPRLYALSDARCGRPPGARPVNVDGKPYRTIWLADDGRAVEIIDQTKLPFELVTLRLESCEDAATAIRDMWVRGAPLIGVNGMVLVGHGRSDAVAVENGIRTAASAAELGALDAFAAAVERSGLSEEG